jgi:hypothetical protein
VICVAAPPFILNATFIGLNVGGLVGYKLRNPGIRKENLFSMILKFKVLTAAVGEAEGLEVGELVGYKLRRKRTY